MPTSHGIELLPDGQRQCLETLLGEPIPDAIARGTVTPGETLDFTHPSIAFVYAWQSWVERRTLIARQFGPSAPSVMLDVRELERWHALKDAWKRLQKAVDNGRPRAR